MSSYCGKMPWIEVGKLISKLQLEAASCVALRLLSHCCSPLEKDRNEVGAVNGQRYLEYRIDLNIADQPVFTFLQHRRARMLSTIQRKYLPEDCLRIHGNLSLDCHHRLNDDDFIDTRTSKSWSWYHTIFDGANTGRKSVVPFKLDK